MKTSATNPVLVGLVQMRCVADKAANVEQALAQIAQASGTGAHVVCLPELFHSLYPCQSEDHANFAEAEPLDGPTASALADAARRHAVVIVGSIFERRAAGLFHNTALVFDADGSRAGVYRKMHIPDDPLYYEKFYFTPGDLGFCSFPTRCGNVGPLVCWDQWFPEAARLTALAGAEFLFYPTAIGWHPHEKADYGAAQHSAWETMMRSHAVANGVYVVAVNRVGMEEGLAFWGGSFVAGPDGMILQKAPHDEESLLIVECDRRVIETARTHWPFLRDRRIDAYGGILKRFGNED